MSKLFVSPLMFWLWAGSLVVIASLAFSGCANTYALGLN